MLEKTQRMLKNILLAQTQMTLEIVSIIIPEANRTSNLSIGMNGLLEAAYKIIKYLVFVNDCCLLFFISYCHYRALILVFVIFFNSYDNPLILECHRMFLLVM